MPPYRASLGGAFGGGATRTAPAPTIDVASIIDSIVGAKASLVQQAILRKHAANQEAAQAHTMATQDAELGLRKSADARDTASTAFEHTRQSANDASVQAEREARMRAEGYDPVTKQYDPTKSVKAVTEANKRSRVVEAYKKAGMNPARAEAAADNPSLASYFLGFHPPRPHENSAERDGMSPDARRAQRGLYAVNTQTDNVQSQLNRTPLPKRPLDQDNAPMENPDKTDPHYQRHPEAFSRDSATVAAFKGDSTRVAQKREGMVAKLDSLGGVAANLAARVQGNQPAPVAAASAPAPAPVAAPAGKLGGAAANPMQHLYDAAATAFKAGPDTPERRTRYQSQVTKIAQKSGQVKP